MRYFNEANFDALEIIREACEEHNLTMAEVALRWENHHSAMKKGNGDAIIIGFVYFSREGVISFGLDWKLTRHFISTGIILGKQSLFGQAH